MLSLRLLRPVVLWTLVVVVFARAYYSSVAAASYDNRVFWALAACVPAWAAGTLAGALLARRWPLSWPRLDLTRHGLALLTTAICVHAMSHVEPQMSIRVVREEIPPCFGPIFPVVCALLPVWLRAGARCRDVADQWLIVVVFLSALGGAIVFLDAPVAVGLGVLALLLQFDEQHMVPGRSVLLTALAVFGVLCAVATQLAWSRLAAWPALTWVVAMTALGVAIGMRPRSASTWRALAAASVLAALVVAACGVVLTVVLARDVGLAPALNSRLVLFQQHPNFLAPFFGFHAVLAVGLGLRRRASAVPWWLAAALLAASTVMTDSRTGIAAMAFALLAIPGLYALAAAARRWRLGLILPIAVGAAALLVAGGLLFGGDGVKGFLNARLDRFTNSLDFRIDAWRNSVEIIRQHPWAGIGPHNFLSVARFKPGSRFFNAAEAPHPHNLFLYVAQSAGVPALLVFLVWIGALAAGLWRTFRSPDAALPRPLVAALLAGVACLLVANLFDLGLSLMSVAPGPLFVITGLQLSTFRPRADRPPRGAALLWTAGLLAVFVPLSLQPVRALARVDQGELFAWEADRQHGDPELREHARTSLARALELDPTVPRAADELARMHESQPNGFDEALAVLEARRELAPHDEDVLSAIGRLYMRAGLFEQARDRLAAALQDTHGSAGQAQDRADLVFCTAMLGRRDEAVDLLADSLRLDVAVYYHLNLMPGTDGKPRLAVGGDKQAPIELVEAAERLFQRDIADAEAGREVGRSFWMATYRAFRFAGRDDRAAALLDYAEAHVPPDVVEPFTIASERAALAYDAGDYRRALENFELAHTLSGNNYYLIGAAKSRRALGETVAAVEQAESALQASGEILDAPMAFRDSLNAQADTESKAGHMAAAAALLERTVLFEDDILARAALWEKVGNWYLQGGQPRDCVRALSEAMVLYAAQPFPWRLLQDGATGSLPGRLAHSFCDAFKALGYDQRGREHEIWGQPSYFSPLMGPSLFRLAFFAENVEVDKLLREADVQILADPANLIAHWARLFGLEASGRHLDLAGEMRTLVEEYGKQGSAERQFNTVMAALQKSRGSGADLWQQLGILDLLRGRYSFAATWFYNARQQLTDAPRAAADLCGWEAMAHFLASAPDKARAALEEGLRLQPDDEMLKLRLHVMPPP